MPGMSANIVVKQRLNDPTNLALTGKNPIAVCAEGLKKQFTQRIGKFWRCRPALAIRRPRVARVLSRGFGNLSADK